MVTVVSRDTEKDSAFGSFGITLLHGKREVNQDSCLHFWRVVFLFLYGRCVSHIIGRIQQGKAGVSKFERPGVLHPYKTPYLLTKLPGMTKHR